MSTIVRFLLRSWLCSFDSHQWIHAFNCEAAGDARGFPMTDVRVGVIGAGNMGAEHVSILRQFVSHATVTMVADPYAEQLGRVAAAAGARATVDPYALIADPLVDAVVIASPDETHPDLTVAAIRAGKPVLCEKPLALSVAECVRVVEEEQHAGRRLVSVGFMRRFDPAYVALKAELAAGTCGNPLTIRCVHRTVSYDSGADRYRSITASAVHEYDIVRWLLGSAITEVSWHAPRVSAAAAFPDPQLILLHAESGVLAVAELFQNARYGYEIRCEVVGETGTMSIANPQRLVIDSAGTETTRFPADWRARFADAYRLELQAWIDAITAGSEPALATAHDGLVTAAVAEAVIASMKGDGLRVAVTVPRV
jgi:myo-inositol 2-dehydrogenase/D-chiro-inositol 1-dehydrogenase